MATDYNEYRKKALEASAEARAAAKNANNTLHQNQAKAAQENYDSQVSDTQTQYDDLYRQNAVQKAINERQIAENAANLGLTDSGLNRTQQTAVQLSYSNNKAKLDANKQKAVDALALSLRQSLAGIENDRLSSEVNIDRSYDEAAEASAQNAYKTDTEAEIARQKAYNDYILSLQKAQLEQDTALKKAQINQETALRKAEYSSSKSTSSSSSANNKRGLVPYGTKVRYYNKEDNYNDNIVYVDADGNDYIMRRYSNPYTGTVNKDAGEGKVFSNGYQPNNIGGNSLSKSGKTVTMADDNGNIQEQNIWKYKDGKNTKYAIWDGRTNQYYTYTAKELKTKFGVKV